MVDLTVRPLADGERDWLVEEVRRSWGLPIVSRGRICAIDVLPALVCSAGGEVVGIAIYELREGDCEVVTLMATRRHIGAGTALMAAVEREARAAGCRRLWLITTNDNVDALRFYQRRGLRIVAVHAGEMENARRLKPSIPATGDYGIPIRDEIELELSL